jgi:O-antigen ligase
MDLIEQYLLLILWLLLIMGLFFPWENFVNPQGDALTDSSGQQGFRVSHAVLMISYACVLLLSVLRWRAVSSTLWLAWPVLILCAWILLSVAWGPDPAVSLNRAARFVITVIFSAYVASAYDSQRFVGLLTRGFAVTVLASLAVMVLSPKLGHSNMGGGYENAWRGAFTHKNWLGAAMSLGVIVSGYSYVIRANNRAISVITFLGCLFLLIMARSATALIAMAASVMVIIVGGALQSNRAPVLRFFALLGLVVLITVLITLPLGLIDINLHDLPKIAGRSSTLTGRTDLWRAVWAAIQARPFMGYGYGFWDQPSVMRSNIWLGVNWEAPHAHNNWLDAALQLGLVGVVITAFIWISALWRGMWLVFVRYGHGALFFLAILFNCLSRSVVETVTFSPGLVSLFWWVICCIFLARIAHQRNAAAALPA